MGKHDNYRVRFDTQKKKKKLLRKEDTSSNLDELRKIIERNTDSDIDFVDISESGFENLNAISRKKGRKALLTGKVLNADKKKYKKWRKHDKKVIREMISPVLQSLYEDGEIGYKRAKKIRKVMTNRIISCFYGIDD